MLSTNIPNNAANKVEAPVCEAAKKNVVFLYGEFG